VIGFDVGAPQGAMESVRRQVSVYHVTRRMARKCWLGCKASEGNSLAVAKCRARPGGRAIVTMQFWRRQRMWPAAAKAAHPAQRRRMHRAIARNDHAAETKVPHVLGSRHQERALEHVGCHTCMHNVG
jgi:hypothetical protein